MPNNTYDNWKAITESDFVTLFIKTWFAYISTLRKMFPEAYNRRGDKKYLNAFKEYYKHNGYRTLLIDEPMMSSIESIYLHGKKIILEQYPEYYFWDFYRLNDDFEFSFKEIPPNKKDCIVTGLKIHRVRGTRFSYKLVGFVRFWGEHYNVRYNENIKFEYDLTDTLGSIEAMLIENSNITEQDFLVWLLDNIQTGLVDSMNNNMTTILTEGEFNQRIRTKITEKFSQATAIIRSVFSLNLKDESIKDIDEMKRSRNTYEIIQQRPMNYFLYHMDVNWQPSRDLTSFEETWYRELFEVRKKHSIVWFLDFVYRIRNALFHEILDPLDPQWQTIFKNSYLVLKEIVDGNIAYLQQNETTNIEH